MGGTSSGALNMLSHQGFKANLLSPGQLLRQIRRACNGVAMSGLAGVLSEQAPSLK